MVLFVAGLLVGTAVQIGIAQTQPRPLGRLNHVAIVVPNINEALTWYAEKMGFHEVIRNAGPDGTVMSAYVQISRDTWLELQAVNAQRPQPLGLNHWGIEVPDLKAAVATYRQRGATVSDASERPSTFSGGLLANLTDPISGGRIELSEQPPEGKLRKASESWKP